MQKMKCGKHRKAVEFNRTQTKVGQVRDNSGRKQRTTKKYTMKGK